MLGTSDVKRTFFLLTGVGNWISACKSMNANLYLTLVKRIKEWYIDLSPPMVKLLGENR